MRGGKSLHIGKIQYDKGGKMSTCRRNIKMTREVKKSVYKELAREKGRNIMGIGRGKACI